MRYCSNCRAELPEGATNCPECGVYAGDVFDGRIRRERRPVSATLLAFLVLAVLGAGYAVWMNRFRKEPAPPAPAVPPVHVVRGRPGDTRKPASAKVSEAEAIRIVVAEVVRTRGLRKDCVVVMSEGFRRGAYHFTAFNHCDQTRLGKWQVKGTTAAPAGP